MIISARKILKARPIDVLNNFKTDIQLKFDNGEVINSTGTQLAMTCYAWEMLRRFPKVKPLPCHHVSNFMKEDTGFTPSTMLKLMSALATDVFDTYNTNNKEEMHQIQDEVWDVFMAVNNQVMNDLATNSATKHATLNMEDILQIMLNPDIQKIKKDHPVTRETMAEDPDLVQKIYKMQLAVLEKPEFRENNIAIMIRSGTIKVPQLMQCIGPRGSLTDMNSSIFAEPIQSGYLEGLRRIYDVLIESRTAAMSLNNQSAPLKFTEYLSRRVQFVGMELRNLHFGDCGSKHHLEFQVRDEKDLKLLESMNCLDEKTGKYKPIRKTNKELIGKLVKVRTVLGCQHTDPNGVCSTCFGEASRNIARYRNLGHYCIISLTEIITQLVLSTKHHTSSANASTISLPEYARQFLVEFEDGFSAGLNPDLLRKFKSVKLVVSEKSFKGLTDIKDVSDIGVLSPKRTSEITSIKIKMLDEKGNTIEETINVVDYRDEGFLSMGILKHMRENGWVTVDDMIEIDLTNYSLDLPIIEITPKQFDMFAYSKGIEKLLESSVKDEKRRATELSAEAFLMELTDVILQKLDINMAIMQVVAATMLCTDISNKDYSMPKPWTKRGVGIMDHVIKGRSLSAALAYENQAETLISPYAFSITNRTDSPMDEFFVPDKINLDYLKM